MATNGAYRRIVVPVHEGIESQRAVRVACGLAAEHGATIVALAVVEIPPALPLDAHMREEEEDARTALEVARGIADSYGVPLTGRIVRAREAADTIIGQAESWSAEVVVLGAQRHVNGNRSPVFGKTAGAVIKESPCRVVLVSQSLNGHYPG